MNSRSPHEALFLPPPSMAARPAADRLATRAETLVASSDPSAAWANGAMAR